MIEKSQVQPTPTKKNYQYNDILKMKSHTIYSGMGDTLVSNLPSAPRTTFGKQERSASNKKFQGKQFENLIIGRQGIGPAGYLPTKYTTPNQKVVQGQDPQINFKYASIPAISIGKNPRKINQPMVYEYMKHPNDQVDIDSADLKRKKSSPAIMIGTERRFSKERLDKVIPGPTYDPVNKPQLLNAPKYSMTARRSLKGQDPLVPPISTTTLVGPGSYFQKVKKSHSTSSLSRVPYDSKIPKDPVVSFAKAPRTLRELRTTVDETYDIKTKTMLSQYDFEYDGGKGYQSGKSWMKKNIINSMNNPLQKNKMGSFTISRASREKQQQKRGYFKSQMVQAPQSVRISIPKF